MFVFIIFETKGNFTIEYQIMTPHLCKMKIHDGILSREKISCQKLKKYLINSKKSNSLISGD